MRRITTQEVLEAFSKIDYTPGRTGEVWYRGRCACGIGALMVAAYRKRHGYNTTRRPWKRLLVGGPARMLKLEPVYVSGFARGWDEGSSERDAVSDVFKSVYDTGYEDGRAAAAAVFGEVSA